MVVMVGCGRNSKKEIATIPPHLEALPSDWFTYNDKGMMLYRVVTLEKEIYEFRKPDYKGQISEKYHFLPGVYSSQALMFGFLESYDGNGEMDYSHNLDIEYFPNPYRSLPYFFDLLKHEGWIDPEIGKGKPVMTINKHIPPYSERLSIHCTWNIQVDHNITGSAGLLVQCDDTTQIVYLIDKLSGNILDRFKR